MFISAGFLGMRYGVDDKIARFFVDREPPANNLYWKDKLLYLRPEIGWLFIPLIVDLLYKLGVSRNDLLTEEFATLLEQIGHLSALEETAQLTNEEAIDQAYLLVQNNHKSSWYLDNLLAYCKGDQNSPFIALATPIKALHRGDLFLFCLCVLPIDQPTAVKLVEHWFALITTLLLLDDAEDVESDRISGDKNSFLEVKPGQEGIDELIGLVRSNLQKISLVNKTMAAQLDSMIKEIYSKPHLQEILNR
jgi:hypothetical protein